MLTNLLIKITGLSPEITDHLESSERSKVKLFGAMMIFTSLSSAIIMGYGISVLSFHNPILFPFIFVFWCIFVYLFERIIVSGNELKKPVLIGRFIAALSFAIIHSLIIDTLFFQTDISDAFHSQEKNTIMSSSQNKINASHALINKLSNENRTYFTEINNLEREIISEADGSSGTKRLGMGKIYKLKNRILSPQIDSLNNQIKSNKASIVKLQSDIAKTETEAKKEIRKLPNDHGLIAQIKMLYDIELVKGNLISRLFSFLFFMIFVFIETLPLFARISFDLKTYNNLQEIKAENIKRFAKIKIEHENEREIKKLILTTTNHDLSDRSMLNIEKMEIHYNDAKQKIRETEKLMELLNTKKDELYRRFPAYTSLYLEPVLNDLESDFKNIVKQMR